MLLEGLRKATLLKREAVAHIAMWSMTFHAIEGLEQYKRLYSPCHEDKCCVRRNLHPISRATEFCIVTAQRRQA